MPCKYCECSGPLKRCPNCDSECCEECLHQDVNKDISTCLDCYNDSVSVASFTDDLYSKDVSKDAKGSETENVIKWHPTEICRRAFGEFIELVNKLPITELRSLQGPLKRKTDFAKMLLMFRMELQSVVCTEITRREMLMRKAVRRQTTAIASPKRLKIKKDFNPERQQWLFELAQKLVDAGLKL